MRQEEMRSGESQLLGWRTGCIGRIEYPARGNPPIGIALAVNVSAIRSENRVDIACRQLAAVCIKRFAKIRCKGELITFTVQRQRFDRTEQGETGQVVLAIQGANMLDQPPIRSTGDSLCMVNILVSQVMITISGTLY